MESVNKKMQIRTQLRRKYRADAESSDRHPLWGAPQELLVGCNANIDDFYPGTAQSIHDVNTLCMNVAQFYGFMDFVWDHEDRHMNGLLAAANQTDNDVHALLEPLVGADSGVMQTAVENEIKNAERKIREGGSTHTGNPVPFVFYMYDGSKWTLSTITLYD